MSRATQTWLLIAMSVIFVLNDARRASAQEANKTASQVGPECLAGDSFFEDEVWAKVGERTCLKCHNVKGDASESEFLLRDTAGGKGQREAVKRTVQDPGLSIGMLLVCLGAGLGAPRWPERVIWFVLAAGWMLWTAWACLNRRRATSC